jgi:uncharacterized protein (AIM24 family)
MAEFEVKQLEGMHFVDIHLNHEVVRIESGALNYYVGEIAVHSQLVPSWRGLVTSLMAGESVYRPTYAGTGTITLESSLGGFHVFDLNGESWILEKGTYWASEGDVDIRFFREKAMTAFWSGEGFVYLQTKATGTGKVVVSTRGPVEQIELREGQEMVVDGNCVIGRMASVAFNVRRSTKNYLGRYTAGEPFVRVYQGPGMLLLNPSYYWRYYMMLQRGKR